MNTAYLNSNEFSFFSAAQEQLEQVIQQLQSEHYAKSEHKDIEKFINQDGQEILYFMQCSAGQIITHYFIHAQ